LLVALDMPKRATFCQDLSIWIVD